jgi:hypothetical protein
MDKEDNRLSAFHGRAMTECIIANYNIINTGESPHPTRHCLEIESSTAEHHDCSRRLLMGGNASERRGGKQENQRAMALLATTFFEVTHGFPSKGKHPRSED